MASAMETLRLVSLIGLLASVSWASFPDGPNQQCADDAGPPWLDDGPTAYYVGYPNDPVLPPSGECPAPLSAACASKGTLAAYLDGPVDCGGQGWFCRITDQPDHRAPGVTSGFPDCNYASCNQSDSDHDQDGHCHGSDIDGVYGWWIRDHWHRNYAGYLKCCCDWTASRGIVNRCDYRKLVTTETQPACRDANEEHTVDWSPGCTQEDFQNYQEPPDATCWELRSFGPGGSGDPIVPMSSGSEDDEEEGTGDDDDEAGAQVDGNTGDASLPGFSVVLMAGVCISFVRP